MSKNIRSSNDLNYYIPCAHVQRIPEMFGFEDSSQKSEVSTFLKLERFLLVLDPNISSADFS